MSPYIITKAGPSFEDTRGNRIDGHTKSARIKFEGENAALEIGRLVLDNPELEINLASNSRVVIGDEVHLAGGSKISAKKHSLVVIGDKCSIKDTNLTAHEQSELKFGAKCALSRNSIITSEKKAAIRFGDVCTFRMNAFIVAHKNTTIALGDGCMAAANVHMRSGDGHSIFDLRLQQKINDTSIPRRIIVGSRVWIGYDTMLMYGAEVGDDSIIGAKSLVRNAFPANSLVIGVPAKLLSENMDWHRSPAISFEEFSALPHGDNKTLTSLRHARSTTAQGRPAPATIRTNLVSKVVAQLLPVFLRDQTRKKFINRPYDFFNDSQKPILRLLGRVVMKPAEAKTNKPGSRAT